MKPKVLIIGGPTASGKKKFALRAAEMFRGEIVSADSRKVYRRLDIGTAKPSREDRERIPHHLIDIIDPDEPFSAGEWVRQASDAVRDILGRRKLPIISGGAGFYIEAFTEGLSEGIVPDPDIRAALDIELAERGPERLHAKLTALDPLRASQLPANDTFRVLRALEIFLTTGETNSAIQARERLTGGEYDYYRVGIDRERETLYRGIDERVERMVNAGLVEELRAILDSGYPRDMVSLDTVGYKEWFPYLDGDADFDTCLEAVKRDTRRYAKRQITWFRHRAGYRWVNGDDGKSILRSLEEIQFWLAQDAEIS